MILRIGLKMRSTIGGCLQNILLLKKRGQDCLEAICMDKQANIKRMQTIYSVIKKCVEWCVTWAKDIKQHRSFAKQKCSNPCARCIKQCALFVPVKDDWSDSRQQWLSSTWRKKK